MQCRFEQIPSIEVFPGHFGQFLKSDRMTFVRWKITEGASVPEHSHPHEQVVNLISGEYILTVDGRDHRLTAGDIFVVSSNSQHRGRAVSACEILDTFAPKRDDYTIYVPKEIHL